MDDKRRKRKRYRSTLMRCALLFAAVLLFQLGYRRETDNLAWLLSDACMVPGMVSFGWALMKIAAYYGAADGLSYSSRWMAKLSRKNKKHVDGDEKKQIDAEHLNESFSEYCAERRLSRVFPDSDVAVGLLLAISSILLAMIAM